MGDLIQHEISLLISQLFVLLCPMDQDYFVLSTIQLCMINPNNYSTAEQANNALAKYVDTYNP